MQDQGPSVKTMIKTHNSRIEPKNLSSQNKNKNKNMSRNECGILASNLDTSRSLKVDYLLSPWVQYIFSDKKELIEDGNGSGVSGT